MPAMDRTSGCTGQSEAFKCVIRANVSHLCTITLRGCTNVCNEVLGAIACCRNLSKADIDLTGGDYNRTKIHCRFFSIKKLRTHLGAMSMGEHCKFSRSARHSPLNSPLRTTRMPMLRTLSECIQAESIGINEIDGREGNDLSVLFAEPKLQKMLCHVC